MLLEIHLQTRPFRFRYSLIFIENKNEIENDLQLRLGLMHERRMSIIVEFSKVM